jgi:hypothetical protein
MPTPREAQPRHPHTGRFLAFDCEIDCQTVCAGLCGADGGAVFVPVSTNGETNG